MKKRLATALLLIFLAVLPLRCVFGQTISHSRVFGPLVAGVLLEEQLMQLGGTGRRVAQRDGGGLAVGSGLNPSASRAVA